MQSYVGTSGSNCECLSSKKTVSRLVKTDSIPISLTPYTLPLIHVHDMLYEMYWMIYLTFLTAVPVLFNRTFSSAEAQAHVHGRNQKHSSPTLEHPPNGINNCPDSCLCSNNITFDYKVQDLCSPANSVLLKLLQWQNYESNFGLVQGADLV